MTLILAHDENCSGMPVLGSERNTLSRYDLSPLLMLCQNGDDVLSARRWGRIARNLVHQVDPGTSGSSMPTCTCMPQITRRRTTT